MRNNPCVISKHQRLDFERLGFFPLEAPVLNAEEVRTFKKSVMDCLYDADHSISSNTFDLSENKDFDSSHSTLQTINLYKVNSDFRKIIEHPTILNVVKEILGDDIQVFRDQAFYKPSRHGGEVYMHQDNRYWHFNKPKAVIVWIALDDATVENGCLHYIQGSHKVGWIKHTQAENGKSPQLEANMNKHEGLPVIAKKGCAIFHDCQVVHW
jgi:2-oxoglutarate-dependent dioxygenase